MCILCGCSTCGGNDALGLDTDEFNLITVGSAGGVASNYKWGNDVRGAASGIITWSLDLTGLNMIAGSNLDEFRTAVDDAFNAWAAIGGVTFQASNNIGAADIDINMSPLSGSTIGIALTSYFTSDGNENGILPIFDSDISMDQGEIWRPDGDDGQFTFVQVMMHEIGHALGLDHFNVSDSIMNATANDGSRLLGDDDIAGIQDLYGARRWSDQSEEVDFKLIGVGQTAFALGGNDTVTGTRLADLIDGGSGNDTIFGGGGNDDLRGGIGNDFILDTRGNNDVFGGNNNDTIIGGGGRLDAEGQAGDDTIIGGIGSDVLNGGIGNDTLRGDPGGSFITGDDRLIAGEGNDWLEGGGGADTFVFDRTDGANRIGTLDLSGSSRSITGRDFEVGVDQIDLDGFNLSFSQIEDRLETVGNDTVFTYDQDNIFMTITIEGVLHTDLTAGDFV